MIFSAKNILIIRLGAIGDVIRTLPALNALRKKFPESHIAWLVEEKSKSILNGHPEIDEIIVVKRERWQKGIVAPRFFLKTIKEAVSFIIDLRKKEFDLVLDFHGIVKSGIFGFLSGARQRIGFGRKFTKEFNFLFNNVHVNPSDKRLNRVKRNISLLYPLEVDRNSIKAVFPFSHGNKTAVDYFFDRYIDNNNGPVVAVHAGSSKKTDYKRWGLSNYAAMADMLIEYCHATVILTWGAEEKESVEKIAAMMNKEPVIACETGSLSKLAELIKRCDLYIGGDTAPMHIAAFLNVPVIAIFGPTDPLINAPFGNKKHMILRKDIPCSPCRNRKCKTKVCLEEITPEQVYRAAEKFLEMKSAIHVDVADYKRIDLKEIGIEGIPV